MSASLPNRMKASWRAANVRDNHLLSAMFSGGGCSPVKRFIFTSSLLAKQCKFLLRQKISSPAALLVGKGATSTLPKMMAQPFGTIDFGGVRMPYSAGSVAMRQSSKRISMAKVGERGDGKVDLMMRWRRRG